MTSLKSRGGNFIEIRKIKKGSFFNEPLFIQFGLVSQINHPIPHPNKDTTTNDVTESHAKKNLNIVDRTGAGDLFASGFLDGYIKDKTIKESLEKGIEMSSKIIQIIGARMN